MYAYDTLQTMAANTYTCTTPLGLSCYSWLSPPLCDRIDLQNSTEVLLGSRLSTKLHSHAGEDIKLAILKLAAPPNKILKLAKTSFDSSLRDSSVLLHGLRRSLTKHGNSKL